MQPAPLEIERVDAGSVRVRWDDGHESVYGFAALRSQCPCAACGTRPRPHPGLMMAATCTPTELVPVGRYALAIHWQDGHQSGIYSWETLRALCPCGACRGPVRPSTP